MSAYIASIGMEVHAELTTRSKMFCRCPAGFGGEPNTRVCPVCLGLPGALPVPNREAIEMVVRAALALNCYISPTFEFERKNYFYPDLPKGYQISQYASPIGRSGWVDIPSNGGVKRVRIRRVHLEEDTGKLLHLPGGESGVDCNRAGLPLMEIVTEFPPDLSSADEAKEYLVLLREILVYLGVCDGRMEQGSLRAEPNVSIRRSENDPLGTKTELKNLGSFRSVSRGVAFEIERQAKILDTGGTVPQETRGWNEQTESSFLMRRKEEENDYRYFPDPDLVTYEIDEPWKSRLASEQPELPAAKRDRYQREWGLGAYDVGVITADPESAAYFEAAVASGGDPKLVCNWLTGDLARLLNEAGVSVEKSRVGPADLAGLCDLIQSGAISGKIAKQILPEMFETGRSAKEIVDEQGSTQILDREPILNTVRQVLASHEEVVAKYKAGQLAVKGYLVGQVMKEMKGRGNPAVVQSVVQEELDKG